MLFQAPASSPEQQKRLDELERLRHALGDEVRTRGRWMGSLRRQVRASSIESSTSIEGFSVSPEEALALTSGRRNPDQDDEDQQAVACYARAMDHVGTLAVDPSFRWLDRVILDLHFDACYFQRDKDPGMWRTGPIGVTGADGTLEYRGPDAGDVVDLTDEIVTWLAESEGEGDVFVHAALAHLNLISVHPFRDGNGRIARILQSLVLARGGLGSPEFFSIEEYLGDHTRDYYAALREAQGGSYQPQRDTTNWVRFCLDAHLAQARHRLAQVKEAADRWQRLEELTAARGWPDRLVIALEQSLLGGSDRGKYCDEAGISPATASGDFRRLVEAGLVEQRGRTRNISYGATPALHKKLAGN
ncbi:MAG TPA: Fic family protein [Solirubrobacterales bacterium]|nr:Fic family protein [Solirubrobacterales bacterium]